MSQFVKVGRVEQFHEGRGRTVDVDGFKIAVFKVGQRFVALQDACPHMGASLADGRISGNQVVCHWHGWKFDLSTGQGDMRSWACAQVFEVKVDGQDVLVRRPEETVREEQPPAEDEEWIRWDPDRFFKP